MSNLFRKPFKIKSNTQLKGSERKAFKDAISKTYQQLTEPDIETILNKRQAVHIIKVNTANNKIVHVYTVERRPLFFEYEGRLLPTIFLLWKFPHIIPDFTIHPQVFSYINSGADLMIPGVQFKPKEKETKNSLPENSIAYVNQTNNQAAVAVGVTAQHFADMLACKTKGKCLIVYHYYGDHLCTIENIPEVGLEQLGLPDWLQFKMSEDFPELGASRIRIQQVVKETTEKEEIAVVESDLVDVAEAPKEVTELSSEEMDSLLHYCFNFALKYSKTFTLPMLASTFLKQEMMPVCPPGKHLDIKRSTYRKLKPFLQEKCQMGLIGLCEIKKGVESITSINKEHSELSKFYVEPERRPKLNEEKDTSPALSIIESYSITASALPLFEDFGLGKGTVVQKSDVRQNVVDYVKKHHCQNEQDKRLITPKDALIKICGTTNQITWEELMEKVCQSMKSCHKVSVGNVERFSKSNLSPIIFSISQRSGNKKVTLVDNLELYGIHIPNFAKECQHGIAASTSISRPSNKKCDQLLVQGNQIAFIYKLLTEKYNIPKRHIRGQELAVKKK